MTSSIRPLSVAVANLFNRSLRTPKEIAAFLVMEESVVSNWFKGEGLPSDRQMSKILRELEYTSGGTNALNLPEVLSQFWNELRTIEESREDFCELSLDEGESVSARLTQFTNCDWIKGIVRNIDLVHPSRRPALVKAMTKIFHQFTDD